MPRVVSGARIAARGAVVLMIVGVFEAGLGAFFYVFGRASSEVRGAFTLTAYGLWGLAALLFLIGVVWRRRAKRKLRLLRNGKVARARILEIDQTSVQINGAPLVRVRLLVEATDRRPFETTIKEVMPHFMHSRLASDTVTVRYDPEDTDHVVIDWNSATPTNAGSVTLPGFAPQDGALQPRQRHVPWAPDPAAPQPSPYWPSPPPQPPDPSAFPEPPAR